MLIKRIYLILTTSSIILFLFFRFPYRTYIYDNNVFDFYIADTSPNFIAIFILLFYFKWQKPMVKNISLCVLVFIGLAIHEFITQSLLSLSVIDMKDIYASAIGSIIAYFTLVKLDNKFDNNKNQKKYYF